MRSNMSAEKGEPSNPSDPDSGSSGELPDPELNPMINPILSQNLGKWAHVYLTSPPEKRARAVAELLRELEEVPSGNGKAEDADNPDQMREQPRVHMEETAVHVPAEPNSLACPECAHINAPDHWFCGFCGSPLKGTALKRDGAEAPRPTEQGGIGSLAASKNSIKPPGDVEWLREKSLRRFQAGRHPLRKVLLAVLAIAAIGGSYFEWRNRATTEALAELVRHFSTAPSPATPNSRARSTGKSQVQSDSALPQAGSELRNESLEDNIETPPAATTGALGSAPTAGDNTGRTVSQEPTQPSTDTGQRELAIAETYLKGGSHDRDASKAAHWLWKSVSKDNAAALILLAGLYERGEGVAKSCDQAEVLLVAAVKKGSLEAGQKLESLHSSGCK